MNHASASELSVNDLKTLATAAALAHNLNTDHFLKTIECESHWNPTAVSSTDDHGLVQINRPSHPEITLSQMNDPWFALEWMAEQWDANNQRAWTCWRTLNKQGWPSG